MSRSPSASSVPVKVKTSDERDEGCLRSKDPLRASMALSRAAGGVSSHKPQACKMGRYYPCLMRVFSIRAAMISGVLVETLQLDLLTTQIRYVTAVALSGPVATHWNSATEDPPPGETAILHQSKQRIRELVGCCRRYRAMAFGGSRDGRFRYLRAELSR